MDYKKDKTKRKDQKSLIDCTHFLNGSCNRGKSCNYRHNEAALLSKKQCYKWIEDKCENFNCKFIHQKKELATKPKSSETNQHTDRKIAYFWDIENCPVPKGKTAFDVSHRVRELATAGKPCKEISFQCFADAASLPLLTRQSLSHGNVATIDVPDRKPGASDRALSLELDRFERNHKPPVDIVLISGDIDFVMKLADLRNHVGYRLILFHNNQAKEELKKTCHKTFQWNSLFSTTGKAPDNQQKKKNGKSEQNCNDQPQHSNKTIQGNALECPVCEKAFDKKSALEQHQETKQHWQTKKQTKKQNPEKNQKEKHVCCDCEKQFTTEEALEQHQTATGHSNFVFECGFCEKQFSTEDALDQHKRATGHDEDIICDECGKEFTSVKALTQHCKTKDHYSSLMKTEIFEFQRLFTQPFAQSPIPFHTAVPNRSTPPPQYRDYVPPVFEKPVVIPQQPENITVMPHQNQFHQYESSFHSTNQLPYVDPIACAAPVPDNISFGDIISGIFSLLAPLAEDDQHKK